MRRQGGFFAYPALKGAQAAVQMGCSSKIGILLWNLKSWRENDGSDE